MGTAALVQRRRRRGNSTDLGIGNAALLTALGDPGDGSVVLAFYDVRSGLTVSSGVVDSWADWRHPTDFGPALTASGTERPAWDGSVVTGDNVNDNLTTAASAKFALNVAKTLVYVGAIDTGDVANEYAASICDGAGVNRLMAIRTDGADSINGIWDGAGAFNERDTGATAPSAIRRLIMCSKNATTAIQARIANSANVTGTSGGNSAAGNNTLTLFDLFAGVGQHSAASVRAVLVLNRAYDDTDYGNLRNWAIAYHGVVDA